MPLTNHNVQLLIHQGHQGYVLLRHHVFLFIWLSYLISLCLTDVMYRTYQKYTHETNIGISLWIRQLLQKVRFGNSQLSKRALATILVLWLSPNGWKLSRVVLLIKSILMPWSFNRHCLCLNPILLSSLVLRVTLSNEPKEKVPQASSYRRIPN